MSGKAGNLPMATRHGPDPAVGSIWKSTYFDSEWYLAENRDVGLSGLDPALHYLQIGADLGRDPGPRFSTVGYLRAHPDVARTEVNPLLHYERHGRQEGRSVPRPGPPHVPPAAAIAASTARDRGWRMTRHEAEIVISTLLADGKAKGAPKRLMPGFDTLVARRYAAAADALYDADCAAVTATVIMPTYNRGPLLEAAVRSVLAQSHRALELIVVDDGSTDDTRDRLEAFSGDARLRVIWNEHAGVSAARNAGLAAASGDYVFYLDSDNTWTPDHVKLMLVGLRATGTDCAYAASCIVTETGALRGYRGEPFDWDACLAANYIDMNVLAHRAELYDECGGFDPDLRRMVDWDLILRYTKGRKAVFLPFIGCRYLEHGGDSSRISFAEPYLYRKVVAEKNRLGKASAAETLDTLSLSFGIKIAAPKDRRHKWGDFHYADSLAEALRRLGHSARIDFRDNWDGKAARGDDVALVLRGLVTKPPRPGQLTLMWNISHPDGVPYDEYALCDRVLVASRSHAALLSMILERPVHPLLQFTDTERFHLPPDEPPAGEEARGLFVGNSRNEYRQMVRWSVENGVPIDIYGTLWDQFIPADMIAAENVPNLELGQKYRSAKFVLNDHWQSMKDFGYVSNRVYDVIASGGRLISDRFASLDAMFGEIVEGVDDEASFLEAVARPPPSLERRRAAADHVAAHHSVEARAREICAEVKRALMRPAAPDPSSLASRARSAGSPDLASPVRRRTVGLLMQRGRDWWTSSAYIRLIGPLTTDHAYSAAGLDLVALRGPDDPRLDGCDACIVQRVAVPDPDDARRLAEMLGSRGIPLYVDTDDAFSLHDRYRAADGALRVLMEAATEVWFSTEPLAAHYPEAAGKARIRRNDLDPRFWRDYRSPARRTFDPGPVRIAYMGTATHHGDLEVVMPAFERLARDYPGAFDLTLVGVTATPPEADWLKVRPVPRGSGSYPRFVRFAARQLSFDVGIAPLAASPFNAAKSDVKFLDYSAMGLLSLVSDGPAYRHCIDAGLAVGCPASADGWYAAVAAVLERREDFAAMRAVAADHPWSERNVLNDPSPLADLIA